MHIDTSSGGGTCAMTSSVSLYCKGNQLQSAKHSLFWKAKPYWTVGTQSANSLSKQPGKSVPFFSDSSPFIYLFIDYLIYLFIYWLIYIFDPDIGRRGVITSLGLLADWSVCSCCCEVSRQITRQTTESKQTDQTDYRNYLNPPPEQQNVKGSVRSALFSNYWSTQLLPQLLCGVTQTLAPVFTLSPSPRCPRP